MIIKVIGGIILVSLLSTYSFSSVSKLISYQGKLTDSSGNILSGSYDFIFSIYTQESGGTALWSEDKGNIVVEKGLYDVILGSVSAIALQFNEDYWLDVQVRLSGTGNYETLSPRQRLTGMPHSFHSDFADDISSTNNYWLQLTTGGFTNLHYHSTSTISSGDIEDGAVITAKLADNSVTSAKLNFNYAASSSEGGPAASLAGNYLNDVKVSSAIYASIAGELVFSSGTSAITFSAASPTVFTFLSATIKPVSSLNRIKINASIQVNNNNATARTYIFYINNGTGDLIQFSAYCPADASYQVTVPLIYVDNPNTTSNITYSIKGSVSNITGTDPTVTYRAMFVEEIAP